MEQANDVAAVGVNAGNVWALESIAMDASEGEVIKSGGSAVLPRNNVIDLERRWVKRRGQMAILTA